VGYNFVADNKGLSSIV